MMEIFLGIYTGLLLLFTILSVIKLDNWVFRVFDYPRLQKFVLSLLCIVIIIIFFKPSAFYYIMLSLMIGNLIFVGAKIYPFTFLSKKQVLKADKIDEDKTLSIVVANVYQYNKNCTGCLQTIRKANPDILLMLETNAYWDENTKELDDLFPYTVKIPLENTYGMLLFSKKELINTEIKYLVENDIPSIHTFLKLTDSVTIRLFAVHPTPPVPTENVRSTERDKELLLVADMAKASKEPVIVFGDLNDVAWSYTTKLFLKMSGLLDPRRGRGFYNTFHAHYFFIRFPLDHAFISQHFKFISMKRLKNFKSDHFPIYLKFQYDETAINEQEPLKKDADDVNLAQDKKSKI